MRVKYNIDTMMTCLIGDPIEQACSPLVQNTMYDVANLNALSLPVKVKKGELPRFIEAAKMLNMKGFFVTMPHKSDIIEYLDICDEASRAFKCVNHVRIVDGKTQGIGLDGFGTGLAIQHEGVKVKDSTALLLGAGAVAGLIAADLCQRGAKKIIVTNRTQEKAKYIVDTLKGLYKVQAECGPLTADYISEAAREANIMVQCTSLGMAGSNDQFETLEFLKKLPKDSTVAEVLYPTTALLESANDLGLKTINGMGMMMHQQFESINFIFGVKLPDYALDLAYEALELAIVLRSRRARAKQ